MSALKLLLIRTAIVLLAYVGAAFAVFQWRNPCANSMSCLREFSSVMKFEKLQRYQFQAPK